SESRKAGFGIPKASRPAFRGNSAVPPGGEQGSGVEEREGSIRPRVSPGCLPRPSGSEVWARRPLSLAPRRARPAGTEMNSFGGRRGTIVGEDGGARDDAGGRGTGEPESRINWPDHDDPPIDRPLRGGAAPAQAADAPAESPRPWS